MNVHSLFVMTVATTSRRSSLSRTGSPADKGETILKAATKVFAQKGFFNAQVADVARAAGIAAGYCLPLFSEQGRATDIDF